MEKAQSELLNTPISRRRFLQSIPVLLTLANAACQSNSEIPTNQQNTILITPEPAFIPAPKYHRKELLGKIKGINFPSWEQGGYQSASTIQSLQNALHLKPNLVGIIATWYQDTIYSTEIKSTINTPTDEDLKAIIKQAHAAELAVMFKTHVIMRDANSWHGQIGLSFKDAQWAAWNKSYRSMIYHYAELAEEAQVELFVVGNELMNPAIARPNDWIETIGGIRQRFKGLLTYAAHIDDFQKITWADKLDVLGLDPYYGLSPKANPSLPELKAAWKTLSINIERVVTRWNKPLIFPEIGYPSALGGATNPWKYTMIDDPYVQADAQLQANCVQALYETFWDKPWFKGVVWWDWHTDPNIGGLKNKHYTPKDKPAAKIIRDYNSRP